MKLIMEPTTEEAQWPNPRVEISLPGDDWDMEHVIEDLVRPALIAWGFQPDSVKEWIP